MDYAVASPKKYSATLSGVRVTRRKRPKASAVKLTKRNTLKKSAKPVGAFKRSAQKTLRWLFNALLAGAMAYGIYLATIFLTTSPQLEISRITVSGNEQVGDADLREWAQTVSGENIFSLDLKQVSDELADHPWVRLASVRKVFPETLHINLVERVPFSRIRLDKTYIMDNYGILIARDDPSYSHLPLVIHPRGNKTGLGQSVAGENVIQSLKIIAYLNQLSFFKDDPIDTAKIESESRIAFITSKRGIKIIMALNMLKENFTNFKRVVDTLEKKGKVIEHIDLSFKNKVVVKHKKAR